MICRLCLQQKKLVKAHIIPKWVFKNLYPSPKNIDGRLIMVDTKTPYSKRKPIGIYDNSILCKECDREIGKYDDYAKKIFLDTQLKNHASLKEAYLIQNIKDIPKIKLFFVSLLWRASVSGLKEFKKINLGNYENKFRKILFNNKSDLGEIEIIIGKFDSKIIPTLTNKNILLPLKTKINGINTYIVYLPMGFKIWVKVDKRNFPDPLNKIAINNIKNEILVMRLGDYEKSKEFKIMSSLANTIPNPYAKTK